jgi:ABC-type Mn2+/Zn2+ transport system permease subunit
MMALNWFIEPFQYEFMRNALLISVIAGVVAPITGYWAVTRRVVYLTDAMSHSVLPGVVLASMAGISIMAGALLTALVLALIVTVMVVYGQSTEDGAVGVVSQALFALGIILSSRSSDSRSLTHILFGNALSASISETLTLLAGGVVVVLIISFLKEQLIAVSFDHNHAAAIGVNVLRVDALLMLSLAGTTVIGLGSVGVLMTISLSVVPAVATRILGLHMLEARYVAVGIGVSASIIGVFASYRLGIPVGPSVALSCTLLLGISYFIRLFQIRLPKTVMTLDGVTS